MMWLEQIDHQLLLLINGAHSSFLDGFFWTISGKLTWVPMYLLIFYFSYKKFGLKSSLWFLGLVVLTVALGDIIAAKGLKPWIARYRPSHHGELREMLHFYVKSNGNEYHGGQYGFVSNHATNFAIITSWVIWRFRKEMLWFAYVWILAALLVGYSRVYLGVHYPSDVLGGFILGTTLATFLYFASRKKLEA